MYIHQQLEDVMKAAESYAEQLAEREDQVAELRERNKQLEDELLSGGGGSQMDELRTLRSRLEQAEDDLEKEIDARKSEESRARELDLQAKSLKVERLKLEADLQRALEKADVLEEQVHSMRQRTEQAAESEGRLGAREKSHKKSLIKALSENEQLRKEVVDLEADVQTLFLAVNEKDTAIKLVEDEFKATKLELGDCEQELDEIRRVVNDKTQQLLNAQAEIHAVGELEVEIEDKFSSKVEAWKQKLSTSQKELSDLTASKKELQLKYDNLLMESGIREIEKQIVAKEEKYRNAVKELQDTKAVMEQLHDELGLVARENESLRNDQSKFIKVALEKELVERDRLKHIIEGKDALLGEERQRYSELYEEKGSLEEELQDREFTMAEYERGHGLTEAVLKQKKLKADIKRRDKEIRRLNQLLSERINAHEKLFETCSRLKKKAGVPESFEFEGLELEQGMKGQSERLKGLIKELEEQNSNLEDERLRLLESLRKKGSLIGETGMKMYGISADQVVLVNEFIENLRDGRVTLPLNDISVQLKHEIKQLKEQLAESQLVSEQPYYDSNNDMERLLKEQANMNADLKQELQNLLARRVQTPPTTPPSSPKKDKLDEMMKMFSTSSDGTEWLQKELQRLSLANESLTKRLLQAQEKNLETTPRTIVTVETPPTVSDGVRVDMSRVANHFQEQQLSALRLPPEEWAEQYAMLNAKLVICIERLASKENQISVLERALQDFDDQTTVYVSQLSLFYREHLEKRQDWNTQNTLLGKEADEARAERDALRTKARRLDTLCAVLEGDEDLARTHAKELSRKIAILQVNEVVLARRYNLLAEQEKSSRNEKQVMENEMIQSETALRERVLYLEEWKAGAQFQLDMMEKRVVNLVPKDSHESIMKKLTTTKHKYRSLMFRYASSFKNQAASDTVDDEVKRLQEQLSIEASRTEEADRIVLKLEQELNTLQDKFQGGASRCERKMLEDRIEELENLFQSLKLELERYKELTEIANTQVQSYANAANAKQTQYAHFQEQLLQVNSRTDDDAIIGKLQHELVTTKVSYQLFVRKFEMSKVALRRQELTIRKLELTLDERNRMLHESREASRARILTLEGVLEHFGVSPNDDKMDEFSLQSMERLSETIANLGLAAEQSEEALRRSEATRRNLELEIATQKVLVDSANTMVKDLNGTKPLADRLLQLNDELKLCQLQSMRQKRELQVLREEKQYVDKLRDKDEEHIRRLEESVSLTENALRRRDDEKHISDTVVVYPENIAEDSDEKPKLVTVSNNSELVEELQRQVRQADERDEQSTRKIDHLSEQLRYMSKRLQVEGLDMENFNPQKNKGDEYYQADARRMQAAAQQTIASLKDIVNRKNQVIDGFKNKLELQRRNAMAERERDQAEIERLTEKLYEDNQNAIQKLRNAYQDIGESSNNEIPEMPQEWMERMEEADVMIERKDRRILDLEGAVEELETIRHRAEGKIAQMAEILRQKIKKTAPTIEDPNITAALRTQILAQEKKMAGLRSAVIALKTEFVAAEEEHEEELIQKDHQISILSSSSKQPTDSSSSKQIQGLMERVENTRLDLIQAQKIEEKLKMENKNLRRQLRESQDENNDNSSATDVMRYQRQVDELKREVMRLKTKPESKQPADDERLRKQPTDDLRKQLQVSQAQNTALRSALEMNKNVENTPANPHRDLKSKLQERTKELVATQTKLEQAKRLLDKKTKPDESLLLQEERKKNAELRRIVQVENKIEIQHLTFEVETTKNRALELEEELDAIKSRRKGVSIEDELRGQLANVRIEKSDLEAELLDRENTIIELRFNQEFNQAIDIQPATIVQKPRVLNRERDLENVVEAMKKVVTKLKSENERLKRSTNLNTKYTDATKKVKILQLENAQLQTANEALNKRLQGAAEASGKVIRLEDALRSTKRQLKEKEIVLGRDQSRLKVISDENAALLQEVEQANRRVSGRNNDEQLKAENKRLLNELNAFDLDFFEEIEDLKYRYQQAIEENRILKQQL